jgi:hypothetical protein
MNGLVRHPKKSQKQIGSFDSSQCVIACSLLTSTGRDVGESPGDDMIALSETALTLVVVKAIAIVGSALTVVFVLAVFGAKHR